MRSCGLRAREPHDRGELWKAAKSMGVANRIVDVLWDVYDVGDLIAPTAVETPESGEECWSMTE